MTIVKQHNRKTKSGKVTHVRVHKRKDKDSQLVKMPKNYSVYNVDKLKEGMKNKTENKYATKIANISNFTGTMQYFHNPLAPRINYTDGVKYISDEIAGWLISDIVIVASMKFPNADFLIWELDVKDGKAQLTAKEDTGMKPKYTQKYKWTDLPDGKIKMYQENGVLMLPRER